MVLYYITEGAYEANLEDVRLSILMHQIVQKSKPSHSQMIKSQSYVHHFNRICIISSG